MKYFWIILIIIAIIAILYFTYKRAFAKKAPTTIATSKGIILSGLYSAPIQTYSASN